MRLMLIVLSLMVFALWDLNMNHGRLVKPAIWFFYRLAGGY
jgi:hypothetical protein